ncbi:hypothetical protein BC830DRAFT_1104540 [Chytriomyces sp. MP71]|nr:hypothetical protein BC830DRAFT_1104540 [Chytriomyces sp. MP71]
MTSVTTILTAENLLRIQTEFDTIMDSAKAWPVQTSKNNVTVRKSKDGHWIGQGSIPLGIAKTFELLTDQQARVTWDKVFDVYAYIDTVEFVDVGAVLGEVAAAADGTVKAGITYSRLTPAVGGMIASRDFVDATVVTKRPGTENKIHDLIWESLDPVVFKDYVASIKLPAPTKSTGSAVRGRNFLAGARVTKGDGDGESSCFMEYCIKSDIKGSVPVWLVDMGVGGSLDSIFAELRKEAAKHA